MTGWREAWRWPWNSKLAQQTRRDPGRYGWVGLELMRARRERGNLWKWLGSDGIAVDSRTGSLTKGPTSYEVKAPVASGLLDPS